MAATMHWWPVGAAANVIVAVAYFSIAATIGNSLRRGSQWRTNRLAVATAAIFLSCGVHHGAHAVHLLWPASAHDHSGGMRAIYDSALLSGWDVLTAAVGLWYWSLRSRFPALVRGASLFEDLHMRRQQAMELHDGVVQGLATAKLALELGHLDEAATQLERTLEISKGIITSLLLEDPDVGVPGSVRRRRPATR